MSARMRLWFAGALAGAALGAASAQSIDFGRLFGVGKDIARAVTGVSEPEEISIGKEITGRMLGAAPLVADAELQAYVNRVGRWVASQAERPDLPWHFGVIDTPAINAFAAPGGYVLITRGLYEILDNEAQLAGVLGHEIGHIVQRHHVTVMQKSAAISAGAQLAQQDRRREWVNNLIGTGAEVFARGLDQDAEFEADRIGIVLAARAGYSPYGLIEVLHKLAARGAEDGSLALLFKTHPAPSDRLARLGDAIMPRVADLPEGLEPGIRQVSADLPPPPAASQQPLAVEGGHALQPQETDAATPRGAKTGGSSFDAGKALRGIFGR
jgi:beta-barrel assembly-enhancing protease